MSDEQRQIMQRLLDFAEENAMEFTYDDHHCQTPRTHTSVRHARGR